jgi:hypothetical protein
MNRHQKVVLGFASANLLLALLFPPIDQFSIAASQVPVFAGFHFFLAVPANSVVNTGLLWIEIIVISVNCGIAWLLLRDRPEGSPRRRLGLQNAVLVFTAANLTLALLFPPFESVFALTKATLPSFEGFYFIFFRQPSHVIVTQLLYLEIVFILVNGALLWLIFKERQPKALSLEEIRSIADRLHDKR